MGILFKSSNSGNRVGDLKIWENTTEQPLRKPHEKKTDVLKTFGNNIKIQVFVKSPK